jgi:hypothetical protein
MKILTGPRAAVAVSVALTICCGWLPPVFAQGLPTGFPNVLGALTHQTAMRTVFPDVPFDRQPLPDLPDDSGPILTIVSVKFADAPRPDTTASPIVSIGIELYGPLPGGVAVGGRFAPEALKVRGLREISLGTAQGQGR